MFCFIDTMEAHQIKLRSRCRYGNCLIKEGQKKGKKGNYSIEFLKLFNVDVNSENSTIYPELVCNKHCSLLTRARESFKKGFDYVPDNSLFEFLKHSDSECAICFDNGPEVKRRKPGPGRGNTKQISLDPEPFLEKSEKAVTASDCFKMFSKLNDFDERGLFLKELVSNLTNDELNLLSKSLAEKAQHNVRATAEKMTSKYQQLDELCCYQILPFINNCDPILLTFIENLCGVNNSNLNEKTLYLKARIVEAVYRLSYSHIIYPLAFLQNLCTYVNTRSRIAVDISAHMGSGSYDSITNWLMNQRGNRGAIKSPDGDIGVAFDNAQVLKKTWYISVDSKMESSVITNFIWIQLQKELSIQSNPVFIPKPWILEKAIIKKVQMCDDPIFGKFDDEHFKHLYYTLHVLLQSVLSDQKLEDGKYVDSIDNRIEKMEKSVKCLNCEKNGIELRYSKRKRICDVCKMILKSKNINTENTEIKENAKITKVTMKNNKKQKEVIHDNTQGTNARYEQVPTYHQETPPVITIGEPEFINPSSFENCITVLRKIGVEANLVRYGGKLRYWIFVCCDGLPFRLCNIIIHETFCCTLCHQSFFRTDKYKTHCKQTHGDGSIPYYLEFDWVVLKPGGGHFEMNSIKSFVELNWVPFFSHLSERLGFKSEKAQYIAKVCRDHHKAWQMVLMFYFGSLRELCTVYVRDILMGNYPPVTDTATVQHPSPEGFLTYCHTEKSNNANFTYLLNQVALYAQAIINYRMALRRNNSFLALAAIHKLSTLFHGRNHPFYQLIELFSLVQAFQLPEEVTKLLNSYFTISVSGDPSKGEDWDFVLENKNKVVKAWIPKGGCKNDYWLTACRNADQLEKLKKNHYKLLGLKDDSTTYYREVELQNEIDEWRLAIRSHAYLDKDSFCGIMGEELDLGLTNFIETAQKKRVSRIDSLYLGKTDNDDQFFQPVFVTPEERAKYTYKNVDMTKELILKEIEEISCKSVYKYYKKLFKEMEKEKLPTLVQLHHEIADYLSEEVLRESSDE